LFGVQQLIQQQNLVAKQLWCENASVSQVNEMFDKALPVLKIPDRTPKGRKRRLEQIKWATVVRVVLRGPAVGADRDEQSEESTGEEA